MYIEALHDDLGNIKACYCADTLPADPAVPLLGFENIPGGLMHSRLNIDTALSMEIEAGSGPRAVIDQASGEPRVITVDRTAYVMDGFLVDAEVTPQPAQLPPGILLRYIRRK